VTTSNPAAIPATLKLALEPASLAILEAALAPPPDRRATASVEIEIEAAGEGTFTVDYRARTATAKKGFARKPLISLRLERGAWGLLREQLQAAVDGFPAAPELRTRLDAWRTLTAAELDGVVLALTKIAAGTSLRFDIAGAGGIVVARGPVDESTRELVVVLDAERLRGLLRGAPLLSVQAALKGDRAVGAAVVAALGPVFAKLKL
jgi:hypothetical protein